MSFLYLRHVQFNDYSFAEEGWLCSRWDDVRTGFLHGQLVIYMSCLVVYNLSCNSPDFSCVPL